MFTEIFELAKTTTLTMVISANAANQTLTLWVTPTPRKGEQPVLGKELTLTASPKEFDESFPACLSNYTAQYQSLVEQTAVTSAILEAAKLDQVAKGAKATSTTTKSAPQKTASTKSPSHSMAPIPTEVAAAEDDDLFGN